MLSQDYFSADGTHIENCLKMLRKHFLKDPLNYKMVKILNNNN